MLEQLLKPERCQSPALAGILLKHIKVYFKEVLAQGKTKIWKKQWKGWTWIIQNEEQAEKT